MATIEQLDLFNYRLFTEYSITPHPKLNVLCGPNASGKTSVLEAIWYLSSGKSFCSKNLDYLFHQSNLHSLAENNKLITQSLDVKAAVRLKGDNPDIPAAHFRISRQDNKNHYFLSNKAQNNVLKHTQALATLLIIPENLLMVGGAPNLRRKRLNWGCFYLFSLYHKVYSNYERALKQRNKSLKQNLNNKEIQRWDAVLAREARYISECREKYISLLEVHFKIALAQAMPSLNTEQITLRYQNTLSSSSAIDLSEQFWLHKYTQSLSQDRRDRHTNLGPHRGDMQIKLYNQAIESQLSRGQWKVFSSILLISQAMVLKQELGIQPIILIDDFSSELDKNHQTNFIRYIENETQSQVFISTVSKEILKDYENQESLRFFELQNPNLI